MIWKYKKNVHNAKDTETNASRSENMDIQCIKQTLVILMTISTANKVAHDAPYNELSFINNSWFSKSI